MIELHESPFTRAKQRLFDFEGWTARAVQVERPISRSSWRIVTMTQTVSVGAPECVWVADYYYSRVELRSYISDNISDQMIDVNLPISTQSSLSWCFLIKSSFSTLPTSSTGPPRQPWVPSLQAAYRLTAVCECKTQHGRGVRGRFGADRHVPHPAWNICNYRRARLEPLNRQGRRDLRRHQDWVDSSIAGTWPWPPGWLDERCMPKCVRKPFWCSDP